MIGKINKMLDKLLLSLSLRFAQLIRKHLQEDLLYLVQGLLQGDLLLLLHAEILRPSRQKIRLNKTNQQPKQKQRHNLQPQLQIFLKLHQLTTFSVGLKESHLVHQPLSRRHLMEQNLICRMQSQWQIKTK